MQRQKIVDDGRDACVQRVAIVFSCLVVERTNQVQSRQHAEEAFGAGFGLWAAQQAGLVGLLKPVRQSVPGLERTAPLGLIGLAGILMRNTLILTQQVSDNLADGMLPAEAIVEAAVRRARPVVLTALAAALAFVPLTFDPLAYVLIGGVLVGTAITLLFVPAAYAVWMRPESVVK